MIAVINILKLVARKGQWSRSYQAEQNYISSKTFQHISQDFHCHICIPFLILTFKTLSDYTVFGIRLIKEILY